MSGCRFTGCSNTATGAVTLRSGPLVATVASCDMHLKLLEGPQCSMSVGFASDDVEAKVRAVTREWRAAHR